MTADNGIAGVKVLSDGTFVNLSAGDIVSVIGVASLDNDGTHTYPVIRTTGGNRVAYLCHAGLANQPMTVVYGLSAGEQGMHAASEFARYAQLTTGRPVSVVSDATPLPTSGDVVLLGGPTVNSQVRTLVLQGALSNQVPSGDGFAIRTAAYGGLTILHLAGRTNTSTLYAVYDYLEREIGCGWFYDGDYVPTGATLVMTGLNRTETPHFKWRSFQSCAGVYWAIKYEPTFWDYDQWQRYLDWAAKKKLNLTTVPIDWSSPYTGTVPRQVFPEMGAPVEESQYQVGFVRGWAWPDEYRTQLYQQVLAYGRSLGIKFSYNFDWGSVPPEYQTAHPEMLFLPQRQYGLTRISPDDPNCATVMLAYLQQFEQTFGTDHIYYCDIYPEESVGSDPADSARLAALATEQRNQVLGQLSPSYMLMVSSFGPSVGR